jgi:hypothetical protein
MKTPADLSDLLKKLTHQAGMNLHGWNGVAHKTSLLDGEQVYIYLFDEKTRWSWMASVQREDFIKLTGDGARLSSKNTEGIRGALASQLAIWADRKGERTTTEEDEIGVAAMLYAGGTQTCKTKGASVLGHFFIILYRGKNGAKEGGLLRPFAMSYTDGQVLDADDYMETIQQVLDLDLANHPEWREGKK